MPSLAFLEANALEWWAYDHAGLLLIASGLSLLFGAILYDLIRADAFAQTPKKERRWWVIELRQDGSWSQSEAHVRQQAIDTAKTWADDPGHFGFDPMSLVYAYDSEQRKVLWMSEPDFVQEARSQAWAYGPPKPPPVGACGRAAGSKLCACCHIECPLHPYF